MSCKQFLVEPRKPGLSDRIRKDHQERGETVSVNIETRIRLRTDIPDHDPVDLRQNDQGQRVRDHRQAEFQRVDPVFLLVESFPSLKGPDIEKDPEQESRQDRPDDFPHIPLV